MLKKKSTKTNFEFNYRLFIVLYIFIYLLACSNYQEVNRAADLNKTIMVGDSEVDSKSAYNAKIPFILVEDGYTEKKTNQIPHDVAIKDFLNFEKTIQKYL